MVESVARPSSVGAKAVRAVVALATFVVGAWLSPAPLGWVMVALAAVSGLRGVATD